MAHDGDFVEVFTTEDGDHAWRMKSANGRILADSGEDFESEDYAVLMAERVTGLVARVID